MLIKKTHCISQSYNYINIAYPSQSYLIKEPVGQCFASRASSQGWLGLPWRGGSASPSGGRRSPAGSTGGG